MDKFKKTLSTYNYELPKKLIAQKPSHQRDKARLLIYRRKEKKIFFDTFKNLSKYLPKNSVLVFNQTRVIPARLPLYKETGGRVEALYIGHEAKLIKVLANKHLKINSNIALFHGRPPAGEAGEKVLYFNVVKKINGAYFLKPNFSISQFQYLLSKHGLTPLPPYMKNSPLNEKQRRKAYQTVFAKTGESVAAPTASLHFTPELIKNLKQHGVAIKFVRLDVGLGTFAPLTEKQLQNGKLHQEKYYIDQATAKFIASAKKQGRTVIAVGTTVARTLESWAASKKLSSKTDLFIRPGYKFKIIDSLITNFHVPESSLLMLVSSLTGRKELLQIYSVAVKKRLKFLSFGDGMLII